MVTQQNSTTTAAVHSLSALGPILQSTLVHINQWQNPPPPLPKRASRTGPPSSIHDSAAHPLPSSNSDTTDAVAFRHQTPPPSHPAKRLLPCEDGLIAISSETMTIPPIRPDQVPHFPNPTQQRDNQNLLIKNDCQKVAALIEHPHSTIMPASDRPSYVRKSKIPLHPQSYLISRDLEMTTEDRPSTARTQLHSVMTQRSQNTVLGPESEYTEPPPLPHPLICKSALSPIRAKRIRTVQSAPPPAVAYSTRSRSRTQDIPPPPPPVSTLVSRKRKICQSDEDSAESIRTRFSR